MRLYLYHVMFNRGLPLINIHYKNRIEKEIYSLKNKSRKYIITYKFFCFTSLYFEKKKIIVKKMLEHLELLF